MAEPAIIVEALRGNPVDLVTARKPATDGGLPPEAGFYAWWTKRESIPGVPTNPHPSTPSLDLFYVGIAPVGPTSSSNLRSRVIGNHMSGNTGSSTFRLTLAALLLDALDLHPRRAAKKVVLAADENASLSRWQEEHLSLTWCVSPDPWDGEDDVIELMAPPLNLAGNSRHPFHPTLTAARSSFRTHARR